MKQHYLLGTLVADPVEAVSMKGTRYVEFGLRDEGEESHQGNAHLVNCSCYRAELWPEILGCRKGDAMSVVGRLR
jgi:hypothetical protein